LAAGGVEVLGVFERPLQVLAGLANVLCCLLATHQCSRAVGVGVADAVLELAHQRQRAVCWRGVEVA
jgi:hypothetical protein